MRIAVVCPYALDRHGGVQQQAVKLVQWLEAEGNETILAAPGMSGGPPGTVYLGAPVSIRANRSVAPIGLHPATANRLRAALAGSDVVHVHEPLVPLVGPAVLTVASAPVVGTFHADPGRGVRSAYRLGRPLLRRLLSRLAVTTAVSAVAAAGVAPLVSGVRIIPNAIDVAALTVPGAIRRPRRVVFFGRDDPRKGLEVLLAAWDRVRAVVPDAELVANVDRPPRAGITFLGPVGEDEKAPLLASAAVAVSPNLGGESFGLVVGEAMAAGCAVVASDLEAFRAVTGNAALLVPPGDVAALAAAVILLLTDGDSRQALAEAGRRRVARYDRAVVLGQYLAAYRDAVQGPDAPADSSLS